MINHMYFIYASYRRAECVLMWFAMFFYVSLVYSTFNVTRNKSIRIRKGYYHNHFPRQFAGALVFTMTTGLIPLNITEPSVEGLLNAHQTTVIVCQWHYCLLCHHATVLLASRENREVCLIVQGSESHGQNTIFYLFTVLYFYFCLFEIIITTGCLWASMFVCLQIVNNRLSFLHGWAMRNVTSSLGKIIRTAVQSIPRTPSVSPRSNTAQRLSSVLDISSTLIFLYRTWIII